MEIVYLINSIVMSFAVSLGVGASTVAISQFFVSIANGKIDDTERKMLGVVYILLRVAMVGILATLLIQAGIIYYITSSFLFLSPFFLALYTVVAVLFINATGMTFKVIPSSIGPAVQAGSWYTLGTLMALITVGGIGFTYLNFALIYAGALLLVIAALNALMGYLKSR